MFSCIISILQCLGDQIEWQREILLFFSYIQSCLTLIFPVINFVFFSLFLLASRVSAVDESFAICSEPRRCGGQSIKFPFFIQQEQDARCGYPGFNISCRNNTDPILSLPDGNYIIHNISYQTQSFNVSKADALSNDVCSHSVNNVTIPKGPFYLSESQEKLFLLYNCNITSQGMYLAEDRVICANDSESNVTLAVFNDYYKKDYASKYCNRSKTVVLPVSSSQGSGNVIEILNRGFLLNWIASNCSVCEETGGKCGFDYSTYHFKCLCSDRPHAWHCITPAPGNHSGFPMKAAVAVASSTAGVVVLIILAICLMKLFKEKTEEDKKIEDFLRGFQFQAPKRYTYSDIKSITNSFQHKLGKGGYGDVYKGKLPDGRHVAVKILNKKSGSNGEEFINEVASISRTSHVNVVTLLGFCFEDRRRALVYEFVPNGSLEKYIFREKADHGQLSWETLYKIAVGIARGLEYLHRGCNTRILHFDIKPHNILLDEEFNPKVSDFGLAKLCPDKESAVSMTGARGTAGYIAPEVFSRNFGKVSHKSDVYSYGMMILEMVGGRRIIEVEIDRTSEIYFPHWIYTRIESNELELGLQGIVDEDDQERARKMIIVSLWCIQTDPSNRPPMSRVVEMMERDIDSLDIPPKPFFSSPPRSPAANSPSTSAI